MGFSDFTEILIGNLIFKIHSGKGRGRGWGRGRCRGKGGVFYHRHPAQLHTAIHKVVIGRELESSVKNTNKISFCYQKISKFFVLEIR